MIDLETLPAGVGSYAFAIIIMQDLGDSDAGCFNSIASVGRTSDPWLISTCWFPYGAALKAIEGDPIKDRGEIADLGTLPNGDLRTVVLIPWDDEHLDSEDCENRDEHSTAAI